MTELIRLYDTIAYLEQEVDDNIFQFTFQRKKGCKIKEAVGNRKR